MESITTNHHILCQRHRADYHITSHLWRQTRERLTERNSGADGGKEERPRDDIRVVAGSEEDLMIRSFGNLSEWGVEVLMLAPMNHSNGERETERGTEIEL